MSFTHLHVHTQYSLLDGSCKIGEIVNRAKELGMKNLAITDHGNTKVLVFVVINDPKGTYYGGQIAAPVAKEIMENILPYLAK